MLSGQGVHFSGNAALLAGSSVLVQNTLVNGLVNGLDGRLISAIGLFAVAFNDSSVELLEGSLQNGLSLLILLIADARKLYSLLGRFNVGHRLHLLQ